MATGMNPAAPHHLPAFITAPGELDIFLNGAAIFLVVMVIALGSVYFRLHALPEHMAHKNANKLQFEVVAILALLALFTHNSVFWWSPPCFWRWCPYRTFTDHWRQWPIRWRAWLATAGKRAQTTPPRRRTTVKRCMPKTGVLLQLADQCC